MRRNLALLLLVAARLAVVAEALSTATDAEHVQTSDLAEKVNVGPKRLLRAARDTDEEEERAILGEQTLLKLSKLAKKQDWQVLSKKLKDKAWVVGKKADHKAWLKAGESPQTKFKEYGWKGKTLEELKKDPRYARYEGFDELWTKAQQKKGIMHTADDWIKLWTEEQKKIAGRNAHQ